MNDLSYTPPKDKPEGASPATVLSSPESKTEYPTFKLNGTQAKAAGLDKCAFGDERKLTIHIKAKRIGGSEYEMKKDNLPPVEFDVIAADDPEPVDAEDEADAKDETDKDKVKSPAEERINKGEDKPKVSIKKPGDFGMGGTEDTGDAGDDA
jgi:hypothetical protein